MSRAEKRRRYKLISAGCWIVALGVWLVRLFGARSIALAAVAAVASVLALGFTIAAAANS